MVKGISKQVIVVQSPDPKLFEQAIFIVKDDVHGVTDEELLKQAKKALHSTKAERKRSFGPLWAFGGAAATGILWLLTALL